VRSGGEQVALSKEIQENQELVLHYLQLVEKRIQAVEDEALEPIRKAVYDNSGGGNRAKGASAHHSNKTSHKLQTLNDITGAHMHRTTQATVLHSIDKQ
jgi:hypothetical protein